MPKDPELFARLSEQLEAILAAYKNNWKELREALEKLREEIKKGRKQEKTYGYEPTHEMPFLGLLRAELFGTKSFEELSEEEMLILKDLTDDILSNFKRETAVVNFWEKTSAVNDLRSRIMKLIVSPDIARLVPNAIKKRSDITQKLMDLGFEHYGRA